MMRTYAKITGSGFAALFFIMFLVACSSQTAPPVVDPEVTGTWSSTDSEGYIEYSYLAFDGDTETWSQDFGHELLHSWVKPYAYQLNLIHGRVSVDVVVGAAGEIRRTRMLANSGHSSLGDAAMAAVDNIDTLMALPRDIAGDSLLVGLEFVYPAVRRGK